MGTLTTRGPHARLQRPQADLPGLPDLALRRPRTGLLGGEPVLFKPLGAESRRGLSAADSRAKEKAAARLGRGGGPGTIGSPRSRRHSRGHCTVQGDYTQQPCGLPAAPETLTG